MFYCNYTPVYSELYLGIPALLFDIIFALMLDLLLSSILLFGAAPTVSSEASVEPTLQTLAELNAFPEDTRRRFTPFCVTGVVQAVSGRTDRFLVLNDDSGWTEIRNASSYSPTPGERVKLTGQAHMSSRQEIDVVARAVVPLGTGTVEPAKRMALGDISEEEHHLREIVTEGIVIDTFPDEIDSQNWFLILKDAEDILPVALHVDADSDPGFDPLRNARVRVMGRFIRTVSGLRKFSGPFISLENRADLIVLDPPLEDTFAAPPLEKSLYRTPREIAKRGKRTFSGMVLAAWGANKMMVRADDGRVINVTLAHGLRPQAPGAFVTVAGYPETDLFRINLTRATVRAEDPPAEPQQEAETITDLQKVFGTRNGTLAIDPGSHGRLMRLKGTILSLPPPNASVRRILLACGANRVPVDYSATPVLSDDLELGAEIEVTGRGLLEIDNWNPDDIFPHIRNLVVVVRTPEDIRVLTRPPWWTPHRLFVVITVLLVALIGIYLWNRTLRRLVAIRGRELSREQVAHAIAEFKTGERTRLAVELHDSLSQTLAGVACHVAACAKKMETAPEVARRCIETADKMLNSCRTELRQCLFDLRSDTLEEPDFETAIRKTLDQLDGNARITVRFDVPRQRLLDTTAHAVLAIIRELTGNAVRHGKATEVAVDGSLAGDQLTFSVTDNGCGFNPETCDGPLQGHFGLEGIRNRLKKLDGSLDISSTPGAGARFSATLLVPSATPQEPRES